MLISKYSCRLCHSDNIEELVKFGERPITKRLLESPLIDKEYVYPITLFFCRRCGFVQILNVIPEKELYTNYVLSTSWKPQPHLKDEIEELIRNRYISKNNFAIEIGCNDGIALRFLREYGIVKILGIEPSHDVAKKASSLGFDVTNDYFTREKALPIIRRYGQADLVICRQVLEHISYIDSFMEGIRSILNKDGIVLFEVPDFSVPLKYGDISAIWEEHVNYFTEDSLAQLLTHYGFEILVTKKYNFSGGALCVIARYAHNRSQPIMNISKNKLDYILCYSQNIKSFLEKIVNELKAEKRNGGKIAIYGAGNRSVILLNYILKDYVDIVVDDQPEKQNRFVPMCHLPILSPEELQRQKITLCLLAVNAENEDIVIEKNKDFTGNGGRFISVLAPSTYLVDNTK